MRGASWSARARAVSKSVISSDQEWFDKLTMSGKRTSVRHFGGLSAGSEPVEGLFCIDFEKPLSAGPVT